jgi:hypothetical protein
MKANNLDDVELRDIDGEYAYVKLKSSGKLLKFRVG